MIKPAKQVMAQYFVLVVKMHLDKTQVVQVEEALELLIDVETLLPLVGLLPMFEILNHLVKYT